MEKDNINATLIAYKPNSVDICRGCEMARYASDFSIYTEQTYNELVDILATYIDANEKLEINETGYSVDLIIDGIHFTPNDNNLYSSGFTCRGTAVAASAEDDYYDKEEKLAHIVETVVSEAKKVAEEIKLARLKLAQEIRDKAEKARAEKVRVKEIEELRMLQQKYPEIK